MNRYFKTRTECPCCGETSGRTLYERSFCDSPLREYLEAFYGPQGGVEFACLEGADFTLVECAECGLIYQRHVGNDELMARLYNRWIDPTKAFELFDARHDAEYFMRLAKQVANVAAYFHAAPSELRCLDFGMGWGHWCRIALAFGCETFGAELSDARIAHAKAVGIKVLSYEQIGDHRFDLINTEQVFEHLREPLETLAYLRGALKPGGLIRVGVPDGWNIKKRLAQGDWAAPKGSTRSLNAVAPLEHINCFHHQSLVRMANRAGLELRNVPEPYAISLVDGLRNRIKPLYYALRGSGDTALYFAGRERADVPPLHDAAGAGK